MRSKKSKRGLGKLEGAHEALTLVVLVPEVGVFHSDHAADNHEAAPPEGDVVEDEVLNGIPLFFSTPHGSQLRLFHHRLRSI